MKMVFIYGPPAVGKAATARELSELTGYRNFINHQASDPVSAILDFEENPTLFRSIANEVKNLILEKAVDIELSGLIMTFCYAPPDADHNLKRLIESMERKGADISFTRLYCTDEELFRRVQDPSRKLVSVRKLTSVKELLEAMKKHNFKEEISYVKNLSIDNTSLSPRKTAERIFEHYSFPTYSE